MRTKRVKKIVKPIPRKELINQIQIFKERLIDMHRDEQSLLDALQIKRNKISELIKEYLNSVPDCMDKAHKQHAYKSLINQIGDAQINEMRVDFEQVNFVDSHSGANYGNINTGHKTITLKIYI